MGELIKKNTLIILFGIALFFIAYVTLFTPLLNDPENTIFRCSDIGKYYSQTKSYMEGGKLENLIEFGNEPGWFINSSNINLISNFNDARQGMILMTTIVFLLSATTIYIFVYRITKNRVLGTTGFLLFIISFSQSVSYYFQARQTFTNFLLLNFLFFIIFLSGKSSKINLLNGIFLGTIIISHRAVMGITGICFLLVIVASFFLRKYKDARNYIITGLVAIFFAFPFLFIARYDIYSTLSWLYSRDYSAVQTNAVYSTIGDTQLGFSLIRLGYNNNIPALDYITFFPIGILGFLIFQKRKKIPYQLSIFFICLTIYVSGRNFFGNRMIGTWEPIFFILLLSKIKGKYIKLLMLTSATYIFCIHNPFFIYGRDLSDSKEQNNLESILQNIPKEKSLVFGSWCVADMFQQLDYTTELNYPKYTIAHIEDLRNNGFFMTPDQLTSFGENYWQFVAQKRSEVLPSFLGDKEIYLVLGKRWDSQQIYNLSQKIKNDPLMRQEVQIMFESKDPKKLISYILKIIKKPVYFNNNDYYKNILKTIKEFK